jgi:hypothetical protein
MVKGKKERKKTKQKTKIKRRNRMTSEPQNCCNGFGQNYCEEAYYLLYQNQESK